MTAWSKAHATEVQWALLALKLVLYQFSDLRLCEVILEAQLDMLHVSIISGESTWRSILGLRHVDSPPTHALSIFTLQPL